MIKYDNSSGLLAKAVSDSGNQVSDIIPGVINTKIFARLAIT